MSQTVMPAAWQQLKRKERASKQSSRRVRAIVAKSHGLAPPESASAASPRYVCADRTPGIRRIGSKHRVDHEGTRVAIDSADVNAYLREITDEGFTAKDFRTWAGTVIASRELAAMARCRSTAEAKRNMVRAVAAVARQLGNAKAVCRKSYVYPAIFDVYIEGKPLGRDDPAVASIIRRHLRAA